MNGREGRIPQQDTGTETALEVTSLERFVQGGRKEEGAASPCLDLCLLLAWLVL